MTLAASHVKCLLNRYTSLPLVKLIIGRGSVRQEGAAPGGATPGLSLNPRQISRGRIPASRQRRWSSGPTRPAVRTGLGETYGGPFLIHSVVKEEDTSPIIVILNWRPGS